jgi:hypothetical protein
VTALVLAAALASAAPASAESVYDYEVAVGEGARELAVEGRLSDAPRGCWEIGSGLESFVDAAQVRRGRKWVAVERTNRCFDTSRGRGKDVQIRYRFRLADAAAGTDRRRGRVSADRGAFFAPPTAWLLRPSAEREGRYRLHVTTPPGLHFVTGLPRVAPDAYEGRLEFMDGTPYAVFTPEAPARLEIGGGEIEWVLMPGELPVPRESVERWIADSARAVAAYYGRFPVPRVALLVSPPGAGRGGGGGSTMGYGSAAIRIGVGRRIEEGRDWVLVHEMVHLGLPNLGSDERWMEEGLATYAEPVARCRVGQLAAADVWSGFVAQMPEGLPGPGDEGLDHLAVVDGRQRWGRTYWGGALFWLLADVALIEKTEGRVGLEDVLAGVLEGGGDIRVRWDVERLLDVADRVAGAPVLKELYGRMALAPGTTDLNALWVRLGVRREGHTLSLDDDAPQAWVRRRIESGPSSLGRGGHP